MTILEKLDSLAAQIRSYAKLGHESAGGEAQAWKRRAKDAIRLIFDEYVDHKSLEEKIDRLFNPSLIALAGVRPIQSPQEDEMTHKFQSDVNAAAAIMDECMKTLRRLHERFDPDREYFPDNTHEQMTTTLGINPASVVKDDAGYATACRTALSRAASKAIDAAMDAKDSRFERTRYW